MSNIFDKIFDSLFNSSPLILVVGKDGNNHRNYESIITGAGYRYTGRYRLEHGFDLTSWATPELIIWDLNINETTRYSVISDIKAYYGIPVLVFTDSKSAMNADKAIASDSKSYDNVVKIKKPVTTEQLLALISQYLYEQTAPLIKDTIDESL